MSSDFQNNRRQKIKIYFSDSPTPLVVDNVCHICTEGGLLRVIAEGETQWWPLVHVFNIRLLETREG